MSDVPPDGPLPGERSYSPERLHIEVSGPEDAAPVVVLHGWGSSAELMRPVAKSLDHRWRVYNVDLPGHGQSPEPPAPWGIPEHAALVRDMLRERVLSSAEPDSAGSDATGKSEFAPERAPAEAASAPPSAPPASATPHRRATLVGHSNGGRIALYMASEPEMKDLIERLALISPSGVTPVRSGAVRLKSALATTLKAPFQVLPQPARDFGLDWLRHSLVWKALSSSDYQRAQSEVMRQTFVKTVNHHLDDRVDRIEVPVLIFWGTEDTAVSRRQVELLEARIPDAGLVELDGAGHYGYLDDPDTVMAGLQHFLSDEGEKE